MKQSLHLSPPQWCPFHQGDSGFLDSVKERVWFVRSPHAKIYPIEEITLDLVERAQHEFQERWDKYEFGQSTFRDLLGSIGAILIRGALARFRRDKWHHITTKNYKSALPNHLKVCLEEESQNFFTTLPQGTKIHGLLDALSCQATQQANSIFDKKPQLRGVNFITFIQESQISTAFSTLDKVFMPLCQKGLDKAKFDAIVQDSGLQLLKDIAWWGNHLESRIIAGTAGLGRPPALSKIASSGEALQFQIHPHQLFQEGHQISHFSCGALFQPGNDGYKNLFEEFVLTLGASYSDLFATS